MQFDNKKMGNHQISSSSRQKLEAELEQMYSTLKDQNQQRINEHNERERRERQQREWERREREQREWEQRESERREKEREIREMMEEQEEREREFQEKVERQMNEAREASEARQKKTTRTIASTFIGGVIGFLLGGPPGAAVGAASMSALNEIAT